MNQAGQHIRDDVLNVLAVVANESCERYVARLHAEMVEEYGQESLPPAPLNAREPEKRAAHRAATPIHKLWRCVL